MNHRLAAPDQSLNAPKYADSDGEWQDWLVDGDETQLDTLAERTELSDRKALLADALKTLNQREHHILTERRLRDSPATLEVLAEQYGISRERVRQIEVRALEKLRTAIKGSMRRNRPNQSHAGVSDYIEDRPNQNQQRSIGGLW